MTCVVGIKRGGSICLGADSCGAPGSSWDKEIRTDLKVFIREVPTDSSSRPMAFGFTSSFRMGQLLRYALNIPKHGVGLSAEEYLIRMLIPSIRDCLRDGGFQTTKDSVDSGGTFMLGYGGRLFTVYDDYQVSELARSYNAIGAGANFAIGALGVLATGGLSRRGGILESKGSGGIGRTNEELLRIALEISEMNSAAVASPFHFVEVG